MVDTRPHGAEYIPLINCLFVWGLFKNGCGFHTHIFFAFFTLRNKSCVLAYACMKKLTHIILRILCVFLPHICAAADEVIYIGGDHTFDANQVINADIHITGSGTITNYGVLNGNIIIVVMR